MLVTTKIYKPLQFLAVTVLFLLPGCRKTSEYDKQRPVSSRVSLLDEAKLTDVSLPVGVVAYDVSTATALEKHNLVVSYEANFAREMLVEFYQLEMERLGWKEGAVFEALPFDVHSTSGSVSHSAEVMLVFEKPRKLCVISIRSQGSGQLVMIFSGPRI